MEYVLKNESLCLFKDAHFSNTPSKTRSYDVPLSMLN